MSHTIEQIFTEEGVKLIRPKSIISIPTGVQKAAIDLFRFLPDVSDPRWSIAYIWSNARLQGIKKIHEEVAQTAIYLSSRPGFRNGYSSYQSAENLRLIARAANNLASRELVTSKYQQLTSCNPNNSLALTNMIVRGTNGEGVTGCPEALYQVRFRYNGRYAGRIGFNRHLEGGREVISISNIQGIPQGLDIYKQIEQENGKNPFVSLILQVKSLFPCALIRGIKNPSINPEFYNAVLSRAGVDRTNYHK